MSKLIKANFLGDIVKAYVDEAEEAITVRLADDEFRLGTIVRIDAAAARRHDAEDTAMLSKFKERLIIAAVEELAELRLLLKDKRASVEIVKNYEAQMKMYDSQYVSDDDYRMIRTKIEYMKGVSEQEREILTKSVDALRAISEKSERGVVKSVFSVGGKQINEILFKQFLFYARLNNRV